MNRAGEVFMRTKLLLVLMIVSAQALWAADNVLQLNLKEGLWETTSTHTMSGMPPIPADTLAKMSPEQRTRMEAAMQQRGMGAPKTDIRKSCVTKEKLQKNKAFDDERQDCSRTVVTSTSSKLEMKIHCEGKDKQMATDGTFVVEAASSDSAKGSMHAVASGNGHTMNIDFTFSSKYLGPACGDVK
jgi:hypothetical protein